MSVTVIVPTYNRAPTLRRALDSVLAQTFRDLRLVVVDDGSNDETPSVVAAIDDERVTYIRQPENRGPAAARNAGVAAATSEWIAFQDSDDEWLPTKLAEQLRAADEGGPDVALVVAGYRLGEIGLNVLPTQIVNGDPTADVLDGWPTITPTWLVRRSVLEELGGFDESFGCLEDWDLAFRLTARYRVVGVTRPLLVKHQSEDSVCAAAERLERALREVLRRHASRWHAEPRRLAHRLRHLACLEYRLGRRSDARRTLVRALARDPQTVATYALLAASYVGPRAVYRVERRWPREAGMAIAP